MPGAMMIDGAIIADADAHDIGAMVISARWARARAGLACFQLATRCGEGFATASTSNTCYHSQQLRHWPAHIYIMSAQMLDAASDFTPADTTHYRIPDGLGGA